MVAVQDFEVVEKIDEGPGTPVGTFGLDSGTTDPMLMQELGKLGLPVERTSGPAQADQEMT